MNSEMIMKEYHRWVDRAAEDSEIKEELNNIADDYEKIEDAFYRNLEFGTGGLRGVIGAGTNRMNIHTVARASQGLARYVNKQGYKTASIAISYDSRIKSKLFARIASEVFVGNGIRVYIYDRLMPTPCLSFAVRQLKCAAGIMITASHNPAQYNGYKVYGPDGCQITTVVASEILDEIEAIDIFEGICRSDFDESIAAGSINYIVPEIVTGFIEAVKSQSVLGSNDVVDKNVSIVYSPLNGTGLEPVLRTLNESGFTNIIVVKEQEQPDGHFPTCPYPNPEIQDAMSLGIGYARKYNADLLLATDPDCDRIGIAVKDADGKYVLLSGNETGMLLLDYICSRRNANGTMPERPVFFKTIVTIDMAERIAQHYGVSTKNVLTGFKYIGEQIGLLESKGQGERYIFGFEESYGYLSGSYVRDKDAVGGALLICEMFAYYKSKGIGLWEKMQELYRTYGYCLNTLHTFEFEGAAGFKRMQEIMAFMREGIDNIGGIKVVDCMDYSKGLDGLPKSNVLKFLLADHCSAVIRPSGTEPKIKVYMSVSAGDMEAAARIEKKMQESIIDFLEFKIF
ncbi:Phosphoglucomutase [uncultured Clostridium sp.]|uniref:phospho-sugar mutase n=1 Tax=Enterocloster citroniae TaxID=358743 RepID=UPI0008231D0E|nr:phospho-sugar mutase [Enterocloster citroniae]MCB7066781.1 phospho-sugar mutase [Enterocloster citroniae]SCI65127.1 Phosphoglucomutase [uncultured Clostridium sp.]